MWWLRTQVRRDVRRFTSGMAVLFLRFPATFCEGFSDELNGGIVTSTVAVQDAYPDDYSHCFGCGRLNHAGHQLKTRVEGDETVSRFTPKPHDMALPGYVYGGLLASLLDCHGMATAAAAAVRKEGHHIGEV